MKIHLNNVLINLELSEFMEILEAQAFDELLVMIMELDDKYKPKSSLDLVKKNPLPPQDKKLPNTSDYFEQYDEIDDGDYIAMDSEDMDQVIGMIADILSGDGDFEISISHVEPGADYYLDDDDESSYDMDEAGYLDYYSEEDLKVSRIVNRFIRLVE